MRILALFLVTLLLAGCSQPAPAPQPPASATYTDEVSLRPRASHEVNFHLDQGAAVHAVLNASAAIEWDLHSHVAGEVKVWETNEGRVAVIDFVAPEAGTYSVWFESTISTTTIVRVNLTGDFELV